MFKLVRIFCLKGEIIMKKRIGIEGMSCAHCSSRVESALMSVDGVDKVTVSLENNCAEVFLNKDIEDYILLDCVYGTGFDTTGIETYD